MKMNNNNVLLRRLVFALAATSSLFVTEIAHSQWVFVARHAIGVHRHWAGSIGLFACG